MATVNTSGVGIGPDWDFDVAQQVYRNKHTGQTLNMANVASLTLPGVWGSGHVSTSATTTLTEAAEQKWVEVAVRLSVRAEEYTAMRTFLQHAYPDVLTQFDAAFKASKRLGV